jgi:hypothetical protein
MSSFEAEVVARRLELYRRPELAHETIAAHAGTAGRSYSRPPARAVVPRVGDVYRLPRGGRAPQHMQIERVLTTSGTPVVVYRPIVRRGPAPATRLALEAIAGAWHMPAPFEAVGGPS